jgi:hypothetical protein
MLSAWVYVYVPIIIRDITDIIIAIVVNTFIISKLLANQHLSFCLLLYFSPFIVLELNLRNHIIMGLRVCESNLTQMLGQMIIVVCNK